MPASRPFSMVLGDTVCKTCVQISSPDVFGRPSLLAQCFDHDVHLNYAAVQNLICGCGKVPQAIAESSDTPPKHCVQHVQQSVDMSIQLTAGVQCYPVQISEVVKQKYVLVSLAWLYPRVMFNAEIRFCLCACVRRRPGELHLPECIRPRHTGPTPSFMVRETFS